jgi:hypothetical protein
LAVRSKRLCGPVAGPAGHTNIYTCPAGTTAIVKHIAITNSNALAAVVQLTIAGPVATNAVYTISVAGSGGTVLNDQFAVLEPGEHLGAVASRTGTLITVSGAELSGVAP